MSDLLTAARQALQEMDDHMYRADTHEFYNAKEALRQAIEQAEQQEPVAWRYRMPVEDGHWVWNYSAYIDDPKDPRCEPLYTASPQRKPLTDEEIFEVHKRVDSMQYLTFARAIERAHGIGEQHE